MGEICFDALRDMYKSLVHKIFMAVFKVQFQIFFIDAREVSYLIKHVMISK